VCNPSELRAQASSAHRQEEDPVVALQAHADYTLGPRMWVAFDATWYGGGEAPVNSGPPGIGQSNSRLGPTFAVPRAHALSLKVAYSTRASTRNGTYVDSVEVAWQIFWFDHSSDRRR
jgi:hypothetical protein